MYRLRRLDQEGQKINSFFRGFSVKDTPLFGKENDAIKFHTKRRADEVLAQVAHYFSSCMFQMEETKW